MKTESERPRVAFEMGLSLQNEQELEQEKSRRKWSEQEYACTEQDDGIKI